MHKIKVPAFTIVDLVVTLIISSIIIGMAYFVLSLFNTGFINYQRKVSLLNDFFFFEKTLTHDWEKARYIKDMGEGNWQLRNDGDTVVRYLVKDKLMIRIQQENRDTLPVIVGSFKGYQFNNKMDITDRLDLTILLGRETITCSYYKRYAAKDLLESNKP